MLFRSAGGKHYKFKKQLPIGCMPRAFLVGSRLVLDRSSCPRHLISVLSISACLLALFPTRPLPSNRPPPGLSGFPICGLPLTHGLLGVSAPSAVVAFKLGFGSRLLAINNSSAVRPSSIPALPICSLTFFHSDFSHLCSFIWEWFFLLLPGLDVAAEVVLLGFRRPLLRVCAVPACVFLPRTVRR